MNKIIFPDANEQLYNSMYGSMATVIVDDSSFYTRVKQAASSSISKSMMEEYKPDKDHFLIHLVALGDDETYGFNKNADGFPKAANEKYHKTFEKFACLYREHNSRSKDNAIGQVKLAMYNPEMKRVEIIVHANKKLASEEYELAKAGKPLSFSMGTSVPWDRDNISGKKCKTASTYEPWMKLCPGKYIADWEGKTINKFAYVHNDEPKFFDISRVKAPADRTAHYLQYAFNSGDKLLKTASANTGVNFEGGVVPSALLPDLLEYNLFDPNTLHSTVFMSNSNKFELLRKLASVEKMCVDIYASSETSSDHLCTFIKHASLNSFANDIDLSNDDRDTIFSLRPETMFYELAKRASVLPFKTFISTFLRDTNVNDEAVKYASEMLVPQMYGDLLDRCDNNKPLYCDNSIENLFDAGDCREASYDLNNTDVVQKVMDEIEDKLSVSDEKHNERITDITITKITHNNNGNNRSIIIIKKASDSTVNDDVVQTAKAYTDAYALYKIAALNDINRFNALSEKQLILTIAQNFLDI